VTVGVVVKRDHRDFQLVTGFEDEAQALRRAKFAGVGVVLEGDRSNGTAHLPRVLGPVVTVEEATEDRGRTVADFRAAEKRHQDEQAERERKRQEAAQKAAEERAERGRHEAIARRAQELADEKLRAELAEFQRQAEAEIDMQR
jgi:hypothetical protein